VNHLLFAAAIAAGTVKGLEIDHVRNDILYRSALTTSDVTLRASARVQSRDSKTIAAIVRAIRNTSTIANPGSADLRYAIRLRDARGAIVAVIYLDAFGKRGLVDGQPVVFSDDAIKRAVTAAFPSLYK
jgi:hypothetical protein